MTCRRFTPAEAHAAGVLNRVVAPEALDAAVEELVAQLVAKPSVPIALTKEHVNAVTRTMSAASNSPSNTLGSVFNSKSPSASTNSSRTNSREWKWRG